MGLKPRPLEESNLHRPRPLGEVRRTVRAKYLGFWAAGRIPAGWLERPHRVMERYFPRGTGSARWLSGMRCQSKAPTPHCPARLRAHSSPCHWQQGAKCSVRGGDAESMSAGRRARIFDVRVSASKVGSRQSLHSAHPPSIGRWLFYCPVGSTVRDGWLRGGSEARLLICTRWC